MLPEATTTSNAVFNYRYSVVAAGSGGKLQPEDEANTAYFPADGSQVDFLAYHPYAAGALTEDFHLPVDVSHQPATDLLTAHADGYNRNRPSVALAFGHCLVKVMFVLKGSDTIEDALLAGARLTIKGMDTKAVCLLTDGSVSGASAPQDIVVPLSAAGTSGTAIVLPRAAATVSLCGDPGGRQGVYRHHERNTNAGSRNAEHVYPDLAWHS